MTLGCLIYNDSFAIVMWELLSRSDPYKGYEPLLVPLKVAREGTSFSEQKFEPKNENLITNRFETRNS